jgi:GNAT superfamily N-acetyltransferase
LWARPLNGLVIPVRSWLSPEIKRFTEATPEFRRIYQQFTNDVGFVGRFVQGVSCDIAFVDGLPAAFVWFSRADAEISSLNATLQLGEGDVYIMEAYVRPTFRGKGLAPIMLEHRYQELCEGGYKRIVALTNLGNRPVLRLLEKRGYHLYHRLSLWRLAPSEWLTEQACHPEAGTLSIKRASIGFLPFLRPRWVLSMRGPGRCYNP